MREAPKFPAFTAPILLLALVQAASAQEKPLTTTKEMEQTVRLTVTGETDLDYVWRRQEITAFTKGVRGTGAPGASDSENSFEGFVALRLTAELSDKVSAVVELGTKRVDGGVIHYFGAGNATASGGTALPIQLREAHVTLSEFLMTELRVEMGISTWGFDLRGKGESMAFDPRHSQRFIRNVNPAGDGPATLGARASDPEEFEPMGFWVRYGRELFSLDLVALPAVIEGGSVHNDESFYAVDLLYKFDSKNSRFGVILSVTDDPGGRSTIFTYGGGVDWKGMESLEAYVEFYFQNGWNNGPLPGVTPVKVGAYAFQAGAEYQLPGDLKPWVGANLTYYSGDGDAAANGKSSAFNSYENVHGLMILEDMYLGFDWDTNYRAVKLSGGVALTTARANDLKIWGILANTQTVKTARFANETTHKLGNELDVHVDWEMTSQVAVNLGIGFLFGSKVLEDSMGGPGANNARRQTLLFTLGTDLKF